MSPLSPEARAILAILANDTGAMDAIAADYGSDQQQPVVGAFFILLARRRFSVSAQVGSITEYVDNIVVPAFDVPRRRAEAIIRAALGEKHLLRGISPLEYFEVVVPLIQLISHELNLSENQILTLISEAESRGYEILGMTASGGVK